jgi:long-subunit acyl-CoA synthetase (AMP-forming)
VDNKHNLVVATHTINRNDLNALAIALKQKKIYVDTLPFWWIKATIMEGNCPMHK